MRLNFEATYHWWCIIHASHADDVAQQTWGNITGYKALQQMRVSLIGVELLSMYCKKHRIYI